MTSAKLPVYIFNDSESLDFPDKQVGGDLPMSRKGQSYFGKSHVGPQMGALGHQVIKRFTSFKTPGECHSQHFHSQRQDFAS